MGVPPLQVWWVWQALKLCPSSWAITTKSQFMEPAPVGGPGKPVTPPVMSALTPNW